MDKDFDKQFDEEATLILVSSETGRKIEAFTFFVTDIVSGTKSIQVLDGALQVNAPNDIGDIIQGEKSTASRPLYYGLKNLAAANKALISESYDSRINKNHSPQTPTKP